MTEHTSKRWSVTLRAAAALGLVIAGVYVIANPRFGEPWLPRVGAALLIVAGIALAIAALRGQLDNRLARLLNGLTAILLGITAMFWPVLSAVPFRFGVAAWLFIHAVLLLLQRPSTPAAHHRQRSMLRRWASTLTSLLALALAAIVAFGSAQLFTATPLPKPDAFYTPPADLPAEHGTLVRFEPLTVGVPDGARAFKILYTTTTPDGQATVSSGTVLAPADSAESDHPLITVAHGTTGVIDGCAPSLSHTPFADGAGTALAELVTEHGYVAVISDYTGMGTPGTAAYLVGEAEARNVLDAALAVHGFGEVSVSTDTMIWGHSQGGQGALWSGQLANEYAPQLHVTGVAALAPASDLFGLANADKTNPAGKTVSAYIAATWNELYPELELERHLTPGSAGPVKQIAELCFSGSDAIDAILRGSQVPDQVFPDDVLNGPFGEQLKAQTPTGPWPAPVLVAQGLTDELVLPTLQQHWVDQTCTAGNVIDFRTFANRDHVGVVASDSPLTPQLVQWTLDRFAGEPGPTTCQSTQY